MKAKRRMNVDDASKRATQRINAVIDAGAYQRLLLHAMMSRETPGAILTRLIDENLRAWRVQANPVRNNDRPDAEHQAIESEQLAA